MNIYLEKAAALIKAAFDVDFEDGSHYGIASNRSIGNPMVHDMLWRATKDPHVRVGVSDEENDYAEVLFHKNPKRFKEVMDNIRDELGDKGTPESHAKAHTMDWSRNHTWSLSMDRSGKKAQSYIGKQGRYGEIEDADEAVLEHLSKYHS